MRLIFKLSLFTMAGTIISHMVFTDVAIAGFTPTIIPDSSTSGLGDTFAPTSRREETEEEITDDSQDDTEQNAAAPNDSDGQGTPPVVELVEPEPTTDTQRQLVESEVMEQPAPEPIRGLW